MRGLLWVCTVPLLLACGAERAARLDLRVEAPGDLLCLFAHAGETLHFAQPYPVASLPAGERSLTFVAGDQTAGGVSLSARLTRHGLESGRASVLVRFVEGTRDVPLHVRACQEGSPVASRRPGGTFAALATPSTLLAADVDDDGRDELLALAADGNLQVLDADQPDRGSYRDTELRSTDGRMVAAADLDGDCRLELVAAAPTGALVVIGADGSSPSPVGDAALDAAAGLLEGAEPAIAIAGPGGLSLVPWRTDAPRTLMPGAFQEVEAADLDANGANDLVATGETGTHVLLASASGLEEALGALPASFSSPGGQLALADLDGDGATDVVRLAGDAIGIAWNRGDAFFEERGGEPALAPGARRVLARDIDGDCRAELIVLGADGAALVYARSGGAFVERGRSPDLAVEIAVLDGDGDGLSEVALLGAAGSVTLWRP